MNPLKLPDNLARLRKLKKVTQEELADFIGVTKASVSKWENGLSMPDILLLPQLAAYFNVTLDALFGYDPQLSKEQIEKTYLRFAAAFAAQPFDTVLEDVRATVRQYYACYPFLLQMGVLLLNHFPMAGDPEKGKAVLREAEAWCARILSDSQSVSVCGDAASLKALIDLQLGNTAAVIETLEPLQNPTRFATQDDSTLILAYHLAGKPEQAVERAQISLYLHLLSIVGTSILYLIVNESDRESCRETIRRITAVAAAYRLSELHPNAMAQFRYQAALFSMGIGDTEGALEHLSEYATCVTRLLRDGCTLLHGDDYFTRLDPWFSLLALRPNPPRDKALIGQSVLQSLRHPAFAPLHDTDRYQTICTMLEKEIK